MSQPDLSQRVGLALQMTLHPRDAALVGRTLATQLRTWAPLVDRIVLSIESRPEPERSDRKALFAALAGLADVHPALGIDSVVYAEHLRSRVAARFAAGAVLPDFAHDGSAFYAPLFGLMRCNGSRVLVLPPAVEIGAPDRWLPAAMARLDADAAGVAVADRMGESAALLIDVAQLPSLAPIAPGMLQATLARLRGRDPRTLPLSAVLARSATAAGLAIAVEPSDVAVNAPNRRRSA